MIEFGAAFPDAPTVAGQEYNVGSEPIARVHSVTFDGKTGGAAYFGVLDAGVKKLGAEILLETKVEELIVDADRQVVGVVADQFGTKLNIKARKGVILSTGGFTRNEQMLKDYCQQGYYCQPLGAPGLDGDGLKMAFALGAAGSNLSEVLAVPGLTLPGSKAATYALWTFVPIVPAILINNRGERFCDEFKFYDWTATALLNQPDRYSYTLFDSNGRDTGAGLFVGGWSPDLEQEVADGLVFKADTLEELAGLIEVPVDKLEASVAKWNEDVEAGADSDYGRTGGLGTIDTAPFYAFKTFPAMFDNMGGLKINENAQVIDVKDAVISRLYAAGNVAGGVLGEHYPGSGSAYNAGVTFGTIAGKHSAALENWG
jgi:urocanate reductase